MIKNLRKKFIAITMCSVAAVLIIIIGSINIVNYCNVIENAEIRISLLEENGGTFPEQEKFGREQKPPEKNLSPEAPFDTRYFTVTLDDNGNYVSCNTGRIAAVSSDTAVEYAEAQYNKTRQSGFNGIYRFSAINTEQGIMYIFLDCSRELSTFYSFLAASISASLAGLLLVFILVLFFSKLAVKPVAESYEKQKRFITDAGHELKTPLTVIDAAAEVLEMESGENEWISSIKNQVKKLSGLTERLVFLSRMNEEDTAIQVSEFCLSDAIDETANSFHAIAAARNKKMITDIEQNIMLKGNEDNIKQLISILLDNAMKYSDSNGTINLSLKRSVKGKEIIVKNTVSGIKPGNHDILFERFYRPDESRNSEMGGYGIGLSVAKAIVAAHKGKITAKSDDGKSIIFKIVL